MEQEIKKEEVIQEAKEVLKEINPERSALDELREERIKIEEATKIMKLENQKMERAITEINIRGRSSAGQIPIEKTEEQKAKEEANRFGAVFGMKLYD